MKKLICLLVSYFFIVTVINAQKIDGQWKGYFNSSGDIVLSGSDNTEYVLELEINGTEVSGLSYSYFQGRMYYVICKLKGKYYTDSKSMKVIEVERIKGNTPPDFADCFQTHYLTYKKEGKVEELVGRWEEAPGQRGGCGAGKTTLVRRTLANSLSSYKKPIPNNKPIIIQKPSIFSAKSKAIKPSVSTAKATPKPNTAVKQPAIIAKTNTPKVDTKKLATTAATKKIDSIQTVVKAAPKLQEKVIINNANFEKRSSEVLKTIQIENASFKVTLYDNGEVDGDSVSVFYNGKLIVEKKRLSEKPITLTLEAKSDFGINELTMYAENLGEIPPNTALMVITDGEKRYEVRISSDLKKSGTIQFIHKSTTQ
jgi:hypothetical protein